MMAQIWAESTWETTNYGRVIKQFPSNIIRSTRQFKRINKKICKQKMSIMFNQIYINEEMLPKYIYIYIYIYNNGYPEEVIDDNIKFTVTRFKNKNKTFGPPKCPVYFRLPWVGSASQSFAERIASSVYRCYHAVNLRPIFTTRMAFNSTHKDKLPIFKQSMLIYIYIYIYIYIMSYLILLFFFVFV